MLPVTISSLTPTLDAHAHSEVKKWNLADGRCLQSNPTAFIGVPNYLGVLATHEKVHCYGITICVRPLFHSVGTSAN